MQSKSAFQLFIALVSLITFSLSANAQIDSLNLNSDSTNLADSSLINEADSSQIEDSTDNSHLSKDALESKVIYKARDTIRYNFETSTVFLYGDAQVNYEDIELKAAYIELKMDSNIVFARGVEDSTGEVIGNPVFKEGEQEYKSQRMTYNFQTEKGKIDEVITQEGEGYIHGEDVKKTGEDVVYIQNGLYTTCAHEHPHFSIAAKNLKVIPNDKIVARPANLIIEDVPTPVLVPFGIFPNRNRGKSGILIPVPGESERDGFYVQNLGYYFYLGERNQLEIESDIYSKGSYAIRPTYNYKTRYKRSGQLRLRYKNTVDGVLREDTANFKEFQDYWLEWTHRQEAQARPNSNFSASVNMGTRTSFTNDINTNDADYLRGNFTSKVSYTKYMLQRKLNFSINARQSQNNSNGTMDVTLPEAQLNMTRLFPFKTKRTVKENWLHKIGISYAGNFRNSLSLNTDSVVISMENSDTIRNTFKNGIAHNVPLSTNFKVMKYFTLNPTVNYRELWYFDSYREYYDAVDDTVKSERIPGFTRANRYSASANLTTKIYGMMQSKRGYFRAFRHVMTPSVGFSYNPENNQGLETYTSPVKDTSDVVVGSEETEYSRFEGGIFGRPDGAESGKLNYSLLNSFEIKVKTKSDTGDGMKKIKLLENFKISNGYDWIKDSLQFDNVTMSGFTNLSKFINLQLNGTFDLYSFRQDSLDEDKFYRINTFQYDENGALARMTRGSFALNFNFSSKKGKKKKKDPDDPDEEETASLRRDYTQVDWDVPWNISASYSLSYDKQYVEENITQALKVNGDLSLTKNWKVQAEAWYDFETGQVSYTRLGILRNLHCWEMKMDWVPIGPRQNYSFYIGIKAPILSDMKYEKRDF